MLGLTLNRVSKSGHISMVYCQKGPTRHAYAWQIGPFWQDTLDMYISPAFTGIGWGFTLIYSLILTSLSTQSFRSLPSVYLTWFFCQYQWPNIYTDIYQMVMTLKKALHHFIYKDSLCFKWCNFNVFRVQFRILFCLNIDMAILYVMQF